MKKITFREYQSECQENVFADIDAGYTRLACVLPTGSGKTTIFGGIISEYLKREPNKRVIVVSHLGLLVTQTAGRFQEEWGVNTGVLQADTYPKREDKVIISTMQSLRELNKVNLWAAKSNPFFSTGIGSLNVGLLIIDECQFVGSESYKSIDSYFPDATTVGFTATPFRENKLMTDQFDKVSYTISMQELIDMDYLVEPKLNLVPFNTTDEADMFAKMIAIYKEKHEGQKAIVFLKTIDQAELCRNIMVDSGVTCSAITSKFTGSGRDKVLSDFRNGDGPDILTTVDVLTAGFDAPNLSAIFIPYKVGSVTTYLQRVGRGLRPYPNKDYCDIYAGALSPGIEAGFWEKVNKSMLMQGRPATDIEDLRDILEHADISAEQYKWTQDVVNMAKDVKAKGMGQLFDMIVTQKFPKQMLDVFIEHPPTISRKGARSPITSAQRHYFNSNGLNHDGVSKQEASAIIMGHKRANGWKPSKAETVPAGKHKDKYFGEVPQSYWFYLSKKFPTSEAYTKYKEWRSSFKK